MVNFKEVLQGDACEFAICALWYVRVRVMIGGGVVVSSLVKSCGAKGKVADSRGQGCGPQSLSRQCMHSYRP